MTTIDFSKFPGLVRAVVQDAATGDVVMVGFMNQEAWDGPRRTGFVTFFSRTRNTLWTKGETSGNRLQVTTLLVDCDDDTVLARVKRLGDGNVCHTGERTCFFRELDATSGSRLQAPGSGAGQAPARGETSPGARSLKSGAGR